MYIELCPCLLPTQHPAQRLKLSQILDHPFMTEQPPTLTRARDRDQQHSRGGQHVSSAEHLCPIHPGHGQDNHLEQLACCNSSAQIYQHCCTCPSVSVGWNSFLGFPGQRQCHHVLSADHSARPRPPEGDPEAQGDTPNPHGCCYLILCSL